MTDRAGVGDWPACRESRILSKLLAHRGASLSVDRSAFRLPGQRIRIAELSYETGTPGAWPDRPFPV